MRTVGRIFPVSKSEPGQKPQDKTSAQEKKPKTPKAGA